MMSDSKQLKIRPYARLLTMLGDQLIKNERIALIELIKNAYDADSSWVKISFNGFGDNFEINTDSKIVIEDAGDGMNAEIIEKHWLNPATPVKKRQKDKMNDTTSKGRVIQGEKGIGRFAIFKLGKKIEIITRAKDENVEHVIGYNFCRYDDDFLTEEGQDKDLFIDNLTVSLRSRKPETIQGSNVSLGVRQQQRLPHGTRIEITGLKGSWTEKKVEAVFLDVTKLQSIFSSKVNVNQNKHGEDFEVWFYKDDAHKNYHEDYIEKLNILLEGKSVFQVDGNYDEEKQEFHFQLNGTPKVLKLYDANVKGLQEIQDRFGIGGKELNVRKTECGNFNFCFYIFDRSNLAPQKYLLDKEDKPIVLDHRIYLYRDGIRVYPYGESDDDWLRIDAYRGTRSLGTFLSNDQVVGYVTISHTGNPKLKDKTSREGLIEEGNATADFIALIQVILAWVRQKPYKRYQIDQQKKSEQNLVRSEQIQKDFDEIKEVIKDNKKVLNLVTKAEKEYKAEQRYLVRRAETTEELAGVGLSVETASHDIMAIMGKAMMSIDSLIRDVMHDDDLDEDELLKEIQSLRGMLSFIEAQLKDIQLLFTSSKQRRKTIKIKQIIEKVERIYRRHLKNEGIKFSLKDIGSPLVAKTTDAVLLQLLLNLFDNSVYWLQQISLEDKRIEILLDGHKGQMIFSDNGEGIEKDDVPYIFEPFYSGKGEEGRGLGLYIARQLLERNDYSIELAELKSEKILAGANFVVNFVKGDE